MTANEALAWPNQDEMEYSIQYFQGSHYWDWEFDGQKWFPLATILHQQRELAKPQWLHLGYRVIERRKAGPPRAVNPDQLKDAVRLPDPNATGHPLDGREKNEA